MDGQAAKKLYIKTYGCQMNVYDSRRMANILAPLGFKTVDEPDDADMAILNTCHIREKATEKVFSDLGRLLKHRQAKEKQKRGRMTIAVAGCVAQAEGEVIMKRAPYVDMVFGPQTYHELPEMIIKATGARVINTDFPAESKFDHLPQEQAVDGPTAFLSIQEGCDKFCTFCVVPYTRGAEFSRPSAQIVEEAKRLRDKGVKEITLLGQNVNAYHDDAVAGLGGLAAALADIKGIERIRYMTSHPRDMDQVLIDAHRDIQQLMPFLHLPVQSGSDKILKAMNRKHTAADYRAIIDRLRAARPGMTFSSDFIVGFPGETDQDFADTMKLAEDIGYVSAYSFKYSARPGTPAANMPGLVPEKIKDERLQALQALLFASMRRLNEQAVGQTVSVLFDRPGSHDGQIQGRSPANQPVHAAGPARLVGQILPVLVKSATASALSGDIVVQD